jgi:CO/xanthine dehydrogenase Mo-binding subunit
MRRELFLRTTGAFGAGLALAGGFLETPLRADAADGATATATATDFATNAWVNVRPDGHVVVRINKAEMGQGVYTGMPMLVAEELDAPFDRVSVEFAPVEDRYNDPGFRDMTTGGSQSTAAMYTIMRTAGATARAMLVSAAAAKWNVPASECTTKAGMVLHAASQRSIAYGDVAVAASALPVPANVPLKDPAHFTLIGTSPKRLDIDAKVKAKAKYGIDTVLPGMLYANVLRPPTFGGTLDHLDATAAKKVHGVVAVVPIASGVAVVATNTWAAIQGRNAVKATWHDGPAAHANTPALFVEAEKLAKTSGVVAAHTGDVDAATGATHEAVYRGPFLSHATMEPMNATADVRADSVDVWAPTQVQSRARNVAAQIAGVPPANVRVHSTFLGGGFGRRLDVDPVADAVEISKAMKKPIKVTWTREDDVKNDFYRTMSVNVLRAKVDVDGNVAAWEHRLAASSVMKRWLPVAFKDGMDRTAIDGCTPEAYAFANSRTVYADFETGVPVGFMRAPGGNFNCFATESFIDELAHAAKKDPLAFRLAMLKNSPRETAVLKLAAEKANYGKPLPHGRAHGIALCAWGGSLGALVAEVSVKGKDITVHRVVMATDSGLVIHPDIVAAQVQGAINYGLAMALSAKITVKNGRIEQNNFYDYTVLRMADAPHIETHIVPSTVKPTGIGELGTPPIAPAIGNAVFALTGKRVRTLPFSDGMA